MFPESAVHEAYAACERLARAHYENFPVASHLLPRAMRPHVAAIYAFARVADDFADEPGREPGERHRLLDDWLARLRACAGGTPGGHSEYDRIFLALGHTIRTRRLPVVLFEDLLSAFRQDIETVRYERWSELLDYCRRSANPVGRLVLRVGGYDRPDLDRASDGLCTALQLTNFWQDLLVDRARGRLYLPAEEWRTTGADEADLDRGLISAPWRMALERAAGRTHRFFDTGRHVCDGVGGRLRIELRLTWLGGRRILDRLERTQFDLGRWRPVLGAADALPLVWGLLTWARTRTDES